MVDTGGIFEAFNKCYMLTGKAKIKGVLEYVNELLENDIKIITFAHHIYVLDQLEDFILSKKIQYVRIDGTVDQKQRYDKVKSFQEN